MKWVTYRDEGREPLGLVKAGEVLGLSGEVTLLDLLETGSVALEQAAHSATSNPTEILRLADVEIAAPLRPRSIRDTAGCLEHVRRVRGVSELNSAWYEMPGFYFGNHNAIYGPNDPIPAFPGSLMFDFELEVGAIIGLGGVDLKPEEAVRHIAGYTIFCDWTARDLQNRDREIGLGQAKGKDGANTLGPVFVTSDELAPFASDHSFHLLMTAAVNGSEVGRGWLDEMDWSFPEIAAYASRGTPLFPGDVLGSGTVRGGCLLEKFKSEEPERFRGWLKPGDVVRLEVTHLGAIEQRIVTGTVPHPLDPRPH